MSDVKTKKKTSVKLKPPKMYKVFILNDDYTTMDFVVFILMTIFSFTYENSVKLMMSVHNEGSAVCGIYTKDIAETKINEVHEYASIENFPLQCKMVEEDK